MPETRRSYRMGVDIGGTFVDFALWDGDRELIIHKVPAEPGDLPGSIMRGIAELAEQRHADVSAFLGATTLLVHGTTIATNAVLTGGGTRTGPASPPEALVTRWRCAGGSRRSRSTTST